jgi:outer membrane protein, heavy metal efflux system
MSRQRPSLHHTPPSPCPVLWGVIAVALFSAKGARSSETTASVPEPPQLPERVTFDDALRIFRERGLDLLIAEASVRSAEGDARIAHSFNNPSFSAGGAYTWDLATPAINCPSCSPWTYSVGLIDTALTDLLTGKRGLRIDVAEAALRAARMSRVDAQRNLEFQVKQQYIQALLARDSLDFALEVQTTWTQSFTRTQLKYRAGQISEADEAKIEIAKLEADQAVSQASQALRVAKAGLAFLLGVRGAIPEFKVEDDLPKYVVPSSMASATRDSLLQVAMGERPDLKAQREQVDRARSSLVLAHRQAVPDFQFDVGGTQGPIAVTPPTFTFGVTLPLPVFYQFQGEVIKAEADLRTQELQLAKTRAQITSDVETAFANYAASREMVERMEGRLLERAKKSRDLVDFQYGKGAASLLDYLDAQRTYIATNVEYLQDLTAYWTAIYALEQAVGKELRK